NDMGIQHLSWGQALSNSLADNALSCRMLAGVLRKIATRRVSPKQISGVGGIAQASGEAYRLGRSYLISVVAVVSLQLGILNLLPMPVLDGGMILMLFIEGLIRRDLSLAVKERFIQVGMVFLILLAAFVMYNDLVRTFRPN